MKKLENIKLFLLLSLPLLLILGACNGKHNNDEQLAANKTVSDSLKCIVKPDAKEFLLSWSKNNVLIYQIIAEPDDMHPTNGNSSARYEINLYTQCFLLI